MPTEAGLDLHRQIDGYCERTTPEFWAEPINAITNAAFILAAVTALFAARRAGRLDGPVLWLVGLMAVIGTGSFLFHTFATVWAAIADTAPIMLFILSYFTIAMRVFGGFGWGRSLLLTLGFVGVLIGLSWILNMVLRDIIGGSVSYVPALLAIWAVGFWLRTRMHPAGNWLLTVGCIFAVSLTARAIDLPLCSDIAAGTHWAWHVLNGVVLGTLTMAVIRHGGRSTLDDARGAF